MLLHLFAAISVSCLLIIIAGKAERPKVNIKCVSILVFKKTVSMRLYCCSVIDQI